MFGLPLEVVIGLVTGLGSFFAKNAAMKRQDSRELMEIALKQNQQVNSNQNDAAQRSSPVLRKIVASMIIFVAFGGLLIVAFMPTVPVTMLHTVQKSVLWGMFEWEMNPILIQANGLFLPEYLSYGVYSVCGFLFGSSLAKATK